VALSEVALTLLEAQVEEALAHLRLELLLKQVLYDQFLLNVHYLNSPRVSSLEVNHRRPWRVQLLWPSQWQYLWHLDQDREQQLLM
jgi:hypothetical protein